MNDFETVLMLDKIKFQKYGKGLIKDIATIKKRYNDNIDFYINDNNYTLICNIYKCLTLAILRYINKCSSPLAEYTFKMKRDMEGRILSEKFLNTDKLTYEWLIDTFQYAANIPADTPNSIYTQITGKQIIVNRNENYAILNKLALLVKDRAVPFTINFNSDPAGYYAHLVSNTNEEPYFIIEQLIVIQTLKSRADSNVKYTLFERAINERLEKLSMSKASPKFIKITEPLYELVNAMKAINLKYNKNFK